MWLEFLGLLEIQCKILEKGIFKVRSALVLLFCIL